MRALTFLLFSVFMTSVAVVSATPAVFYVKINQNTASTLGIWYKKSPETTAIYSSIPINETGETSFELPIDFEQIMHLEYVHYKIPVKVRPGERPQLEFDAADIRNSLNFFGTVATENNFMAAYAKKFGSGQKVRYDIAHLYYTVAKSVSQQASTSTSEQFFAHRNERLNSINSWLEKQKNQIPDDLYQDYLTHTRYNDISERITYFIVNKERLGLIGLLKLKEQYPLAVDTYGEEQLLTHPSYQNYLKARLQYEYLPGEYGNPRAVAPILYDLAESNFRGKAKWYLKAEILCQYINKAGEPSFGQSRYPDFYKNNPYSEYTEQVKSTYGSDLNAITSTPAPLLEVYTTDGRKLALQDFRGQVVYIAFWASWCKPCLQNFQKAEATRRQLADMGVILFNVSIDKDENKFHDALQRQNIFGMNVLAADVDKTSIEYNLSTIPAYYIIDKNGKFAFLSEGSKRNIVDEFKELVNR